MPFPFKNFIPLETGNAYGVSISSLLAGHRRCFLSPGQDDKNIRFGALTGFVKKGEKYIMVENGKPEYVVMHYDDYAELVERKDSNDFLASSGTHGDAPLETAASEDFNSEAMFPGPHLPEDISKIRLEDLPL